MTQYKILTGLALMLCPLTLAAQSETTALQLTHTYEPQGSARYAALSGAMGAIGSDPASIARNPAGISLFSGANRLSLTYGYDWSVNKGSWYGGGESKMENSAFRFKELYYQMGAKGGSNFSVVLAARHAGRFDRSFSASASGIAANYRRSEGTSSFDNSLADYAAAGVNNLQYDQNGQLIPDATLASRNAFSNGYPWLSIFGAQAGWIKSPNGRGGLYSNNYLDGSGRIMRPSAAYLSLRETGAITDYDLAVALRATETLRFGASFTYTDMSYNLSSIYREDFEGGDYLGLQNRVSISSGGFRVGLGLLYEPLDGLRVGASLYTPSFMYTNIDASPTVTPRKDDRNQTPLVGPATAATAFRLHTPWRLGASAAYIIGHRAILSADYECVFYGSMRLGETGRSDMWDTGSRYDADNERIAAHYTGVHTLRLGAELMATQRLALRAGYRYSSSPVKSGVVSEGYAQGEVFVPGTQVHYTLPGALNSFSLGAGYRITPDLSLDLAFVSQQRTNQVFAFPFVRDYGPVLNRRDPDVQSGKVQPENLLGLKAAQESLRQQELLLSLTYRF